MIARAFVVRVVTKVSEGADAFTPGGLCPLSVASVPCDCFFLASSKSYMSWNVSVSSLSQFATRFLACSRTLVSYRVLLAPCGSGDEGRGEPVRMRGGTSND